MAELALAAEEDVEAEPCHQTAQSASEPAVEENAEIAQLKKQYGGKVSMIKEMFPTWTDEDAVLALKECDGDLEVAVERITDGKS